MVRRKIPRTNVKIDPLVEDLIDLGVSLQSISRFFSRPSKNLYDAILTATKLLESEIRPNQKIKYFRARLHHPRHQKPKKAYTGDAIKNPPSQYATAGRLNPSGISHLYLSSALNVAVAEVGGVTGDHLTVAEFSPKRTLTAVDFRKIDSIENQSLRPLMLYLDRLFASHVDSYNSYEMLVTQWIVELLKIKGIDCVIYSSVAVGLKEPELDFKFGGKSIEYYNLCALKPEKWKITKNSPKAVKVRSMSVVALDDEAWIKYQALTELAKDPLGA